jgi:hypothetical protein
MDVQVNGGARPVLEDDGLHVAAYLGDLTGNARYSTLDASRALRIATGLDSGSVVFAKIDPRVVGDITGNGRLSSLDATLTLQEGVGIHQAEFPLLPANLPTVPATGPDPLLSLPKNLRGQPGDVVPIPVNLDVSDELEAADLALSYDTRRLELHSIDDVQRGSLTGDFDLLIVNHDAAAGTIRVGLGRTLGPVSERGGGSVLELRFRVKADAQPGRAVVNLRERLDGTRTLLNEGGLVLGPAPTDHAGDELDGAITIVRGQPRRPASRPGPKPTADGLAEAMRLLEVKLRSKAVQVVDEVFREYGQGPKGLLSCLSPHN